MRAKWPVALLSIWIAVSWLLPAAAQTPASNPSVVAETTGQATSSLAPVPTEEKLPPLLGILAQQGMHISSAPITNGMPSWIAEKDGQKALLITLPNTNNLLLGNIFDPQGNNVTNAVLSNIASVPLSNLTPPLSPALSASKPAELSPSSSPALQVLDQLHTIDVGQGSRDVFLFLDPLCQPCRNLYQQIVAAQQSKPDKLRLRVVPVGILSTDSAKIAAGLWQSTNRTAALQEMVRLAADSRATSELAEFHNQLLANVKDNAMQAVNQNNQFLQSRKLKGVPVLFWLDAQQKPKMIRGAPKDISALLEMLFAENNIN